MKKIISIGIFLILISAMVWADETIPDYTNDGGTGDRTTSITVTGTGGLFTASFDDPNTLVNGVIGGEQLLYFITAPVAGDFITFDFGVGATKRITEAKWYQSTSVSHGTWKWQASDDAVGWTDIGGSFVLGGSTTQTQTELSGNGVHYRYYRLAGVSGSASENPWLEEIEFKIAGQEPAGAPEVPEFSFVGIILALAVVGLGTAFVLRRKK